MFNLPYVVVSTGAGCKKEQKNRLKEIAINLERQKIQNMLKTM